MRLKQKLVGLRPDQDRKLKSKAKALKMSVNELIRHLIDSGLDSILTDKDFA
jgi:hypothetical protein